MLNFNHVDTEVIIVDDEKSELDAYSFLLKSMGVKNVTTVDDSRKLERILAGKNNCVLFLDLNMPHKSGRQVLVEMRNRHPRVPVIICTANSEIETAVECLKLGAHDYLVKPVNMNTFGSALRNGVEICTLRNELFSLKGLVHGEKLNSPQCFSSIITRDPVMHGVFHYIEAVATSGQPVMILGETGAGKELVARAIHDASRLAGNFVAVDVSGLDDPLFSDTLFGHEKGAYTGAEIDRRGLIEKAAGGTLFLDEIGELSRNSQIKLLRLLQEGVYYPLGSDQPRRSTARIVGAANRELNHLVSPEGEFRMDLYYRLSTHLIRLPPLRERKNDIPLLISHLAEKAAKSMNRKCPEISREFVDTLVRHPFPGNVRELKTYIYDAVARCRSGELTVDLIDERMQSEKLTGFPAATLNDNRSLETLFGHFPELSELTQYAIGEALEKSDNNQSRAAELLGISKQALSKRLKRRRAKTAPGK
ncbi:sigma-54-dependent transcriptional regulator [Desulforhopalus singaporensis]|uniref:DNA-binding transcriptional response regulator, NtrC family, contains REC, AAA-type ATPase, and a Fis-type DNA-binding domains n=1 Tax=Desulforhopalus singaporensis TaxID=91360 RepID=A0A1H0UJB0_9BACT|nr:sigma-54 dependent transcriptional regulator [Desulforhopalus singaporensis]SDP66317.1 DNA-binding transcriptional response regulator, NtrC family, contains REC, AAA-type ATPase, and a Fis-type DNA-binding domains [Desulforhopalus singaporensis]